MIGPAHCPAPRHAFVVRLTHWIHAIGFAALLISGGAILIAHPRLYWGETGAFGSPALIELPLPLNLDQSGWGRSLHFLSAWICVANGIVYACWGFSRRHFRKNLLPATADFRQGKLWLAVSGRWSVQKAGGEESYNILQRLSYSVVVFILFPVMVASGLAMSPAIRAAAPIIVAAFGGHQSARTIHFFGMILLTLFLIVHIAMVASAGFKQRMRAMLTSIPIRERA